VIETFAIFVKQSSLIIFVYVRFANKALCFCFFSTNLNNKALFLFVFKNKEKKHSQKKVL
jgi:hypothetical protein